MNEYRVLLEIRFAARSYNPGEVVMMSQERAAKYLAKQQIELVSKPVAKKEAKS